MTKKLSQNGELMMTAVPQQGARPLQQPKIIGRFLVVAHQQSTTLTQPRERSLDHPAACWIRVLAVGGALLFTDPADMRLIAMRCSCRMSGWIIVAFVKTPVVRRSRGWYWTRNHHRLDGVRQEFGIVPIRASHHDCKRATRGFGQDAPFGPSFSPVSRVAAYLIPPDRALLIAVSAACHSQSTPPSSWQCWTKPAQICWKRPRWTQRWKVRCTVLSSGKVEGR